MEPLNQQEGSDQQQQHHPTFPHMDTTTFVENENENDSAPTGTGSSRTTRNDTTTENASNTASSLQNQNTNQVPTSSSTIMRFPSSSSLHNLANQQQQQAQQAQQQQQYYSSIPVEHLRTLDVHTVLRGKRDSTEGFIRGEGGSINIRPVMSQEDHEIMEDKVQLVEKCCSVAASITLDDAFDRPQSVFTVKNKRQQKEIMNAASNSSSSSSNQHNNNNNNNQNSGGYSTTMMNMTSAFLGTSSSNNSSYNNNSDRLNHLSPGSSASIGHFGNTHGMNSSSGGTGNHNINSNQNSASAALSRKHLRGDKWRWVLQRFQHNCPKCGGPAVDYVLVVTTHTNTSSPRVAGVLFTDSFPCVNNVHRHLAETHEIFRKQEALLLDFQGKIASLISHTDMFVSFDVMKLRDDVVAPYWQQLLITRNLRAPCQFIESNLNNLMGGGSNGNMHHNHHTHNHNIPFGHSYHLSPTSGGERTNTAGTTNYLTNNVMSPGTILPPSTHQLNTNNNNSNNQHLLQNQATVTGISSDSNTEVGGGGDDSTPSPATTNNTTTTTAPSMHNTTRGGAYFPSTPAQLQQQQQQQQLSSLGLSASQQQQNNNSGNISNHTNNVNPPQPPPPAPSSNYGGGGVNTNQQQQSRGIDASTVYNSIKQLHIILSYRSVVLLGSNSSKSMIRGWLDFFRAIYDPSRVVLPDPVQIPPVATNTNFSSSSASGISLSSTSSMRMMHTATNNNNLLSDTVSVSGASTVNHNLDTTSNISFNHHHVNHHHHQNYSTGLHSIPQTPNITSSSNNNNGNVPTFISLFNQRKFNWLPLPHVAAQAFCSNSVENDLLPALKKLSEEDFERDAHQVPCVCIVEDGTGQLIIPHMQIYSSNDENLMVVEATESSKLMTTLRQILLDIGTEQEYRQMVNDSGKMARERIILASQRSKMNTTNNTNSNNKTSSPSTGGAQATNTSSSGGGGFFSSLFGRGAKDKDKDNTNNNHDDETKSTVSHDLSTLAGGGAGVVLSGLSNHNNNNNLKNNDGTMSEVNSVSAMTVASTTFRHKTLLNRHCCESILFRSALFWATWGRRYSHLPQKWDLTFIGLGSDRDAPYWMEKKQVALIEYQLRM